MKATRTCKHPDGCPRKVKAKGWCRPHWRRICVTGDPGPAEIGSRAPVTRECSVADCRQQVGPDGAGGMCVKHRRRYVKHGDPQIVEHGGRPLYGPENPMWSGDDCTYKTAHRRISTWRGKASDHACVDCGMPAHEWSYDGKDPSARYEVSRGWYSPDPSRYDPRCRSCHRRFDHAVDRLRPGVRIVIEAAS